MSHRDHSLEGLLCHTTDNLETGCKVWRGHLIYGYGKIQVKGKMWRIHRYVYKLVHGELSDQLVVRHSCDNKACINPEHLLIGTHADNARDKVDRQLQPKGEQHWKNKLTAEQVKSIRLDNRLHRLIAADYGIHKSTVSGIKIRQNWKDL